MSQAEQYAAQVQRLSDNPTSLAILNRLHAQAMDREDRDESEDRDGALGFEPLDVPTDVPVGTVPDYLEPFWTTDDTAELEWRARFRKANPSAEAEAEALHLRRLTLAVTAYNRARRRDLRRDLAAQASRCQACGKADALRTRSNPASKLQHIPEAWHLFLLVGENPRVSAPAVAPHLAAYVCSACHFLLPALLAQRAAAETVDGRSRAELLAEFLESRLGPAAPASPAAADDLEQSQSPLRRLARR